MHQDHSQPDSDTVVAILLANHQRFLSFLEARVGSRQDAEEILQDAFVRSLQKADTIRDTENVVAWFYRLLRNAVVDHYRRQAAGQRSLETFARQLANAESPDPALERVLCECVKELVPVLSTTVVVIYQEVSRCESGSDSPGRSSDAFFANHSSASPTRKWNQPAAPALTNDRSPGRSAGPGHGPFF